MSLFNNWNRNRGGADMRNSSTFGSGFVPPETIAASSQSPSLSSLQTIQVTPAVVTVGRTSAKYYQTVQWKPDRFKPAANVQAGSVEVQGECTYFEVRIESVNIHRSPTLGIGIAAPGYNSGMVGWKSSVGYHADDGKVFAGEGQGTAAPVHHQVGVGDTMGCLWLPSGRILFTKNGMALDKGFYSMSPSENYCPTVTYETEDFLKFTIVREPGYFMFLSLNITAPLSSSSPFNIPNNPPLVPVISTPPPIAPSTPTVVAADLDKGKENEGEDITEEAALAMAQKLALFVQQLPKKREVELKAKQSLQQQLDEVNDKVGKYKDPLVRFTVDECELESLDMDKLKKIKEKLNTALSLVQEAIEEKDKCIICMETRRTIAFLPCKHVCCCTECSNVVHKCPICRAEVTEKLCLYIA
eukprot:TRINITY_DN7002_c0_g1_i1.p1 TRINITY_DN7002_c0_g1~~TRINITY_DN7002_c0_g1_i1.p1  ORF type:complete len:414 (-),score=78.10 TRINITY_DN7002_c0_g1_i1:58-1299(-)